MMRRLLPALAALSLLASGALAEKPTSKVEAAQTEPVVILKTVQGDITLHFFPGSAPEHVKNFLFHSREGNYTGTYFHRVIPGFMIQGGDFNTKDDDPGNDGMGGHSYKGPGTDLPAEFNERKHLRGILSMARSQDPNSAGSQFFIMHKDYPSLDGKYTVFGEVVRGLDVVDKIVGVDRDRRDRPLQNQTITEVLVEDWPVSKVEGFLYERDLTEGKIKKPGTE